MAFRDFDDTDFSNARTGLKHFVNERTSIEAQLRRRMSTDEDFNSSDLILAVDGINSVIREQFAEVLERSESNFDASQSKVA